MTWMQSRTYWLTLGKNQGMKFCSHHAKGLQGLISKLLVASPVYNFAFPDEPICVKYMDPLLTALR